MRCNTVTQRGCNLRERTRGTHVMPVGVFLKISPSFMIGASLLVASVRRLHEPTDRRAR
ncbi:hypothetical protein LMG27177_02228 [Paraburkholderia fynbosensis]|uniref:Uncharacterized protein n=1 Tax=Paraburkholderia fynbosensis TaxID=1200993 RepID=A0A6J5FUC0_9BURK|nr:hypothetical protein LMG27177_02228 [Paraburkholderia fynbosensis]